MPAVRTVNQIFNQITAAIIADPTIGPLLTSTSSVAYWSLVAYIVASAEALEEQLATEYQTAVEAVASESAPNTVQWIYNQALNFQYSATNPQIIQFNTTTFAPYWPIIDPTLRIVTRCSVSQGVVGYVNVKIATGTTPIPLSSAQLSAFSSFMNQIKPCGIIYNYISVPADRLFCQSTITYLGAYSGTIASSLLTAYNNFLSNLPFNGAFRLSALENALLAVPGVQDIEFQNVNIRTYLTPFPPGGPYNIINNYIEVFPSGILINGYIPLSGYIEDESTSSPSGYDFLTNTTLIPI